MKVTKLIGIVIFISILGFSTFNKSNTKYFSNYNYHHNFKIDFNNNSYCYQEYTPYNLASKNSEGYIRCKKDTIFIISDYDVNNLPIRVIGKDNNIKKSKISVLFSALKNGESFEASKTLSKHYKSFSYVIINNKDTFELKNDFLLYGEPIKSVYLIGLIKPLSIYEFEVENKNRLLQSSDTTMKQYILEYLKQLEQDSFANPSNIKNQIIYKTKSYVNINKYNELNLSLDLIDLDNYRTMNDTLIFKDKILLEWFIDKEDKINLSSTSLHSIQKYTTFKECINN